MAVVYKAKDTLLGRLVAVKVLRDQFAQDETFVERPRRELKGARLSINIVSIFDVAVMVTTLSGYNMLKEQFKV